MTTINTEALRLFESLNRKQYELETKVTALKNITDSATHQEYTADLRNGVKELARKIEVGDNNRCGRIWRNEAMVEWKRGIDERIAMYKRIWSNLLTNKKKLKTVTLYYNDYEEMKTIIERELGTPKVSMNGS